jgi:hypothetical protein
MTPSKNVIPFSAGVGMPTAAVTKNDRIIRDLVINLGQRGKLRYRIEGELGGRSTLVLWNVDNEHKPLVTITDPGLFAGIVKFATKLGAVTTRMYGQQTETRQRKTA